MKQKTMMRSLTRTKVTSAMSEQTGSTQEPRQHKLAARGHFLCFAVRSAGTASKGLGGSPETLYTRTAETTLKEEDEETQALTRESPQTVGCHRPHFAPSAATASEGHASF